MNRLSIALAFVAGLACATLLGAAAPRGKPITWEYRMLDAEVELAKMTATVEARVAATRSKYASDSDAREAAKREAEDAWMAQLTGDGWLLLGEMLDAASGRRYLLAKPGAGVSVRATKDADAFAAAAIAAALAKHEDDWKKCQEREFPGAISARDPFYSTEFRKERVAIAAELQAAEMQRCGKRGTLFVPWSRERSTADRLYSATISSD